MEEGREGREEEALPSPKSPSSAPPATLESFIEATAPEPTVASPISGLNEISSCRSASQSWRSASGTPPPARTKYLFLPPPPPPPLSSPPASSRLIPLSAFVFSTVPL